ncbi:hypothetical protein LTR28_008700 [Elasticomyces elasticus]|nr:hypothetical protein LTR28_008700 [Elasticomyces elasticus]
MAEQVEGAWAVVITANHISLPGFLTLGEEQMDVLQQLQSELWAQANVRNNGSTIKSGTTALATTEETNRGILYPGKTTTRHSSTTTTRNTPWQVPTARASVGCAVHPGGERGTSG